jgi:hypothetical protein
MVFNSQVDETPCEERVVLFFSSTEHEASSAALAYGKREAHEYCNADKHLVRWIFAGTEALEEVGAQPHPLGWEVATRHFRPLDIRRAAETETQRSPG